MYHASYHIESTGACAPDSSCSFDVLVDAHQQRAKLPAFLVRQACKQPLLHVERGLGLKLIAADDGGVEPDNARTLVPRVDQQMDKALLLQPPNQPCRRGVGDIEKILNVADGCVCVAPPAQVREHGHLRIGQVLVFQLLVDSAVDRVVNQLDEEADIHGQLCVRHADHHLIVMYASY